MAGSHRKPKPETNETAVGGINNPFRPPYLVAGAAAGAGGAPPRPPSARKKSIVELRTLAGVGAAAAGAGPFGFCFSTIIKLSSLLAGNSTALVVAAASGASSAEVGFKGRLTASEVAAAGLADGSGTVVGAAAGFGVWPFVAGSGILGAGAGVTFGCSFGTTGSGLVTGVGAGAGTSTLGLVGSTTGLGTSTGLGSGTATGAGLGGAGLTGASTLGGAGFAGSTGAGFGFGSSTGLGRSWTPEGLILSAGFWSTGGLGSSLVGSPDSGSDSGCFSVGASVKAGELLEISLPVKNIKIRLIKPKRFLISSNASEKYQRPNMASSGISIYLSINSRFFVKILLRTSQNRIALNTHWILLR